MTLKSLSCTLVLACAAPAFAQTAAPAAALPSVPLPAEIAAVLRAYERAWTANQPAALARLFTPDGMALPNGSPPAQGAAAISAEYARAAGTPLALRALAFHQAQDLAYVVGGFAPAPDAPDFGKFVLVLRRGADGAWRIAADIDNMNARPQRAPQPAAAASRP